MNLRDYVWFNNPRGLHAKGPYTHIDVTRYTRPRMGWAKLLAGDTEHVEEAAALLMGECMPVVRIFRERMAAMHIPEAWYDEIYRPYIRQGVRWFELYDAVNLPDAWPQNTENLHYNNREGIIAPLMEHWLDWAERIVVLGGYPAFPSLAETTDEASATARWANAMVTYLRDEHPERLERIIGSGLWFATQPDIRNHFYQEPPEGPIYAARPYYEQTAAQGGWHFEHPYDPIQQLDDRGRTVFGSTPRTPNGAPHGLIATAQMLQTLLSKRFNAGPVPVVGTAGGIQPVPLPGHDSYQQNSIYPPYDHDSHVEATLALYHWIVDKGPPWFWGLCLSTEDAYYDVRGTHPVISRMVNSVPPTFTVPDKDTGGVQVGVSAPLEAPDEDDSTAADDLFAEFDDAPGDDDDRAIFELLSDIEEDPLDDIPVDELLDPQLMRLLVDEETLSELEASAPAEEVAAPAEPVDETPAALDESGYEEAPEQKEEGPPPPPPYETPTTEVTEPQPGDDLLTLIQPGRLPLGEGFIDVEEYAATLELPPIERWDEPAPDEDFVPEIVEGGEPLEVVPELVDEGEPLDFVPEFVVEDPPEGPEPVEVVQASPPPAEDEDPEPRGAFFAMVEEFAEEGEEDDRTPLERFEWLIESDGSQRQAVPDDERRAPNFFDIVEEFTGQRPDRPRRQVNPPTAPRQAPERPVVRPEGEGPPAEPTEELPRIVRPTPRPRSGEAGGGIAPPQGPPAQGSQPTEREQPAGGTQPVYKHFLVLGPGVPRYWLIVAHYYWDAYHPTVLGDWHFLEVVPASKRIVATVILTPEHAYQFSLEMRVSLPHVRLDLITSDEPDDVYRELQRRVNSGHRFGGSSPDELS